MCECYGKPVNNVVMYAAPNKNTRGVLGSTRYVDMEIETGKQFENFYWVEGPLETDQGTRITVLHNGQVQQCSHCLRRAESCPSNGMGKVCEKMGTPRGQMGDYMNHLKYQHNYVSLKQKYQQEEFPQLGGRKHFSDGFGHIVEENEDVEDAEITVVENKDKDAKIAEHEALLSDHNKIKQQLVETKSRLESAKKKRKPDPEAERVAKIVITSEAIEYDSAQDKVITKNEDVLNRLVDENCKATDDRDNRKLLLKNKVLEKVRVIERKRKGVTTAKSLKRGRSDDSESDTDGGSQKSLKLSASKV